jgi:hypothetical protein
MRRDKIIALHTLAATELTRATTKGEKALYIHIAKLCLALLATGALP